MRQLIKKLQTSGILCTPAIINAFQGVDRADFVPLEMESFAYNDTALPIGYGQTISQPSVVAFMLELLQPRPGEKILDVGSGSCWQTALLAKIVGLKGRVVAIERLPEVYAMGKSNLEKYGFANTELILGDGTVAVRPEGHFDKIIAAASGNDIPQAFESQLKIGGVMVLPIRESIFSVKKTSATQFDRTEYPGFVFVPLIKDQLK